jgi:hypothetical protein
MAGNDGTEVPLRSRQPTAPLVDRDEPETALERQRNGARFPEIKVSGQARRNGRRQRVNLEPRGQIASGCPMQPARSAEAERRRSAGLDRHRHLRLDGISEWARMVHAAVLSSRP